MKLSIASKIYNLPLKHPFTISRYTVTIQKTVIVSISDGEFTGYGEATANPFYGSTVEKIQASVASVKAITQESCGLHPSELWTQVEPHLQGDYFALCAIDCASWDFDAQSKKRTLRSFWSEKTTKVPLSNYTIGIDAVEIMKSKVLETPWPCYKIKLGTPDDINIVSEIRTITNAVLRVDVNCAWRAAQTIEHSKTLQTLDVEFIEQPLKVDDLEGMLLLKQNSELPLIADESCKRLEDLEHCAQYFHGINIKLMKCGGITPALKMIEKARFLRLQVMAGCMTESTIGISNLVQLAPLLDAIDADGAMLLKEDVATGVSFDHGAIVFSEKYGSGTLLN
jgi:L-alanine-DL-glutamate epimerase-like enolase superfamily enzyme